MHSKIWNALSAFRFRSPTTTAAPRQHVWRLGSLRASPGAHRHYDTPRRRPTRHYLSTGADVCRHSPRHGELEVRPIRHRLPDRVRAQVFLRMLSCYLSWYLKQALAPILFHDHDEPAAAAQRRNPVRCGPAFQPRAGQGFPQTHRRLLPRHSSPACSPTWPPSAPTTFSPPTTCQRSP